MAQEAEVFGSLSFLSQLRYRHLVAGVAGGVTATLLTHPFDLIKLRLAGMYIYTYPKFPDTVDVRNCAVQDGKGTGERTRYRGPIHAFRSILREEGVRQLYRGASANVAGSGTSWGLYFFFYNAMKFSLQEGDIDVSLSALHHLMCAVVAGALTLTVTNPIWVVKTRMCLASSPSLPRYMRYKGLRDGLLNLWRHEGLRGMYTVSPHPLYFLISLLWQNTFKKCFKSTRNHHTNLSHYTEAKQPFVPNVAKSRLKT
jgi:solute carrier family 25 folate transporter 32